MFVCVYSITQQCEPLDVGADAVNQSTGLLWNPCLVGHDEELGRRTVQTVTQFIIRNVITI